jgi:anaerobic selenocysteine-containing dehydrogenase
MPNAPAPEHEHTVETACPLDCPDSCSLSVTVQDGKVVTIDGSTRHRVTAGYICAKVRKFPQRLYGPDRLLHPAVRVGPKGSGQFKHVTWDEALDTIANVMRRVRDQWGGEAVLPCSYGGSNGWLTQDTSDARLFHRFGASRLARTLCAMPTSTANETLYGKMPSVTYEDYPYARLIVMWGANPSASGIHLVPYVREAQRRGATLVVVDPRTTPLARRSDLHLPIKPGTDVAVALSLHRHLFETGLADMPFLTTQTHGWEQLRERARPWTFERAADVAGVDSASIRRLAELYGTSSPALIRCGWGLERNRNGGSAAMAVMALPAVGGKFGVRGGGYTMSNSAAWALKQPWIDKEPATRQINMNHLGRALTSLDSPPIKVLFVYNCNPAVTVPDQNRVLKGLAREDLMTVVFDQVMTDTARYADIVLPATTFLENYDFAKGYGPISLQLGYPVIDAIGLARPNVDVFSDLCQRLDLDEPEDPKDELEMMLKILSQLPEGIGSGLRENAVAVSPIGPAPIQFVDVFPRTTDRKVNLFSETLDRATPAGLYAYQADPATPAYPLTLISPSSDKTITSTLGELSTSLARLLMHPADARARGLEEGDTVRLFNELGEIQTLLTIGATVRPGTVVLPKGLWRRSTLNGYTATALAPDRLTDIGGGACFNDARVQAERVTTD